ncbi:MAG: hypothetical protein D3922_06715, partial [Candidatus Electrothrix sp. AR1]|nr:hypothetical protein [Candidatus Electrothrix sp. AR1]
YEEQFRAFNFPVDYPSSFPLSYDFSYARFEGRIFFIRYHFGARVDFRETEFCQSVMFRECVFSGPAFFLGTKKLSYTGHDVHLFEGTSFLGDIVLFRDVEYLDLKKASFSRDTRLQLGNVLQNNPRAASEVYRRAQEQCVVSGQFKEAQDYHYQSLECHRKGIWKQEITDIRQDFAYCLKEPKHAKEAFRTLWRVRNELKEYLLGTVFKWTTGYLLKPWRVIGTMLFVIFFTAFIYPLTGGISYTEADVQQTVSSSLKGFGLSIYFSVVTFTTLGYGDFSPNNTCARILCNIESFLGVILSGLLIVTLAKQVLRE